MLCLKLLKQGSHIYLRGNYELSVNDNDKLFNHVQTFIQETTRFI